MSYLADEAIDPNRDIQSVREIPLPNGNIMYAKRDPQFGFWSFNLDKGQIPRWLQGVYTSLSDAQKAIDRYMKELKEPAVAPVLSSKKADKTDRKKTEDKSSSELFNPV